jgi:hypothetical protein
VQVPQTPTRIHMVDGRYWARGEKARHPLSDPEVQRYHELARRGLRDAADLLHAEVARDPAAVGLTAHAHLFGVAQPVGAPSNLLERIIGGSGPRGWHDFLHGQVRSGSAGRPLTNGWSLDLPGTGDPTRRARGWALRSERMRAGRDAEVPALDPIVSGVEVRHLGRVELRVTPPRWRSGHWDGSRPCWPPTLAPQGGAPGSSTRPTGTGCPTGPSRCRRAADCDLAPTPPPEPGQLVLPELVGMGPDRGRPHPVARRCLAIYDQRWGGIVSELPNRLGQAWACRVGPRPNADWG